MGNRKRNGWVMAFRWPFAIILAQVGLIGFLPAGPYPTENALLSVAIWLGGTIIPLVIAFFLIRPDLGDLNIRWPRRKR